MPWMKPWAGCVGSKEWIAVGSGCPPGAVTGWI